MNQNNYLCSLHLTIIVLPNCSNVWGSTLIYKYIKRCRWKCYKVYTLESQWVICLQENASFISNCVYCEL